MPSPTRRPNKPQSINSPSSPARSAAVRSAAVRQADGKVAPEVVDPVWIIKAFGITVLAALICGYLTVCLLFYQGQWQLVLHPSRSVSAPATIAGMPIQIVRFAVDESAQPQLAGWWLPAEHSARYSGYTVLYLPSGDGSLAGAQPTLAAIHSLGLNLFAFDYRGYGQSAATHPNQQRMAVDAAAAWQYLTVSRAVPPATIVPFGSGAGSFLAVQLAAEHPGLPAVVLDAPPSGMLNAVLADRRTRMLPVRLLFHDRFELQPGLSSLKVPKLFLLDETGGPDAQRRGQSTLAEAAPPPKTVIHLKTPERSNPAVTEAMSRFLDLYLRTDNPSLHLRER